jgi:hypothetical protein
VIWIGIPWDSGKEEWTIPRRAPGFSEQALVALIFDLFVWIGHATLLPEKTVEFS